jgi:hypothetical protein
MIFSLAGEGATSCTKCRQARSVSKLSSAASASEPTASLASRLPSSSVSGEVVTSGRGLFSGRFNLMPDTDIVEQYIE